MLQIADSSMDEALKIKVHKTQEYKKVQEEDWQEILDPLGLTMSYDMGWYKGSSGNTYNSLSGRAFLI